MQQSPSKTFSRHQKKKRNNAKYETTDARTKKNCNSGISLERPVEKLLGAYTSFTRNPVLNSDVAPNNIYMFDRLHSADMLTLGQRRIMVVHFVGPM